MNEKEMVVERQALQKGECGVTAALQRLPEKRDFIAPLQYIEQLIPGTLEDKATFVKLLNDQSVRSENVVAICIDLIYMYDFKCCIQYSEWCKRNLGLKESSDICNRRKVGGMLFALKNDPELFKFLVSVPYRKNVVLLRSCDHKNFTKFLKEKQREILDFSREELAELRNRYFGLPVAAEQEGKPEQLTFDFAAAEKEVLTAARSEAVIQKFANKIKPGKAEDFFIGSINLVSAAVTFWEDHPEARPAGNLAEYRRGANEVVKALDAMILPDAEK